jgi:hypothetical protein
MLSITFYGSKAERLKLEGNSLREILELQRNQKFSFTPIAFQSSNGRLMYYHENIIHTFLHDEDMSMIELLEFCECKAIWKNIKDVFSYTKTEIDKGHLWKQNDDLLTLVDDDQFIQSEIDHNCFEKIV